MHLLSVVMYVILLFGQNLSMILFRDDFRLFVQSVATIFHSDWQNDFLRQNPLTKHRFKPTNDVQDYNQSDFIYPMIIYIDADYRSCLVHRNLKIARNRFNSSLIYVDILNLNYTQLPRDRAEDNRITARIACKHVLQNIRRKEIFNENLVELIAEKIHRRWIQRNNSTNRKHLLVPYRYLPQIEKDKDRKAVFIACRIYNEQFFFERFNTTPVYLTSPVHFI